MKSADLHKLWGMPDNSRLTPKQLSFRLPVHVAAQINALLRHLSEPNEDGDCR